MYLIEDRFGEIGVLDVFIVEEPCVVETRDCVHNRVGRNLLETDDDFVEKADGCVSFDIIKAQSTSLVELQVDKDNKALRHVQWSNNSAIRITTKQHIVLSNSKWIRRGEVLVPNRKRYSAEKQNMYGMHERSQHQS